MKQGSPREGDTCDPVAVCHGMLPRRHWKRYETRLKQEVCNVLNNLSPTMDSKINKFKLKLKRADRYLQNIPVTVSVPAVNQIFRRES